MRAEHGEPRPPFKHEPQQPDIIVPVGDPVMSDPIICVGCRRGVNSTRGGYCAACK
jgi:hypothetical protein